MTLQEEWKAGIEQRAGALARARKVAAVTVPHLAPPSGHIKGNDLPDPFQSLGARGVNSLSSKLLLTLFPPQAAFFTFDVDMARVRAALGNDPNPDTLEDRVKAELQEREKTILAWLATSAWRPRAYELLRQGLVSGSPVVRLFTDRSPARVYSLEEVEVRRNARGELRRIITREKIMGSDLSPEAVASLPPTAPFDPDKEHALYTVVQLKGGKGPAWEEWQELEDGLEVPFSRERYATEDDCPWIAPRFVAKAGVDYPPSFGEEVLGDLRSLEGLSQAIVEAATIAARTIFGVPPDAMVQPAQLHETPNGGYFAGRPDLIGAVHVDKQADMAVSAATRDSLRRDLELAFMLHTAIQRDAERVTAEEIRRLGQEIDDALGGALSVLADELQRPLVRKVHRLLVRNGTLEDTFDLDLRIVTGLEAVGRGQEFARLDAWADFGRRTLGEQGFAESANAPGLLLRAANLLGIDQDGIVLSADQLAAREQQQAGQGLTEAATPEMMKMISALVQKAQAEGQPQ